MMLTAPWAGLRRENNSSKPRPVMPAQKLNARLLPYVLLCIPYLPTSVLPCGGRGRRRAGPFGAAALADVRPAIPPPPRVPIVARAGGGSHGNGARASARAAAASPAGECGA